MGARNAAPPALEFSFHPQGKLLVEPDDDESPKPIPVSPSVMPSNFRPGTHIGENNESVSAPAEFFVETVKILPAAVQPPRVTENAAGASRYLKDVGPLLPSSQPSKNGRYPLEQGYSQVEWMKRMQKGANLGGHEVQLKTRPISLSELKKHSTEKDAWTVLRGRVYNITPYMSFHPGGRVMLLKGAGKDCTALFNKYHAWVNAECLLEKCFVGVLDVAPDKSRR